MRGRAVAAHARVRAEGRRTLEKVSGENRTREALPGSPRRAVITLARNSVSGRYSRATQPVGLNLVASNERLIYDVHKTNFGADMSPVRHAGTTGGSGN